MSFKCNCGRVYSTSNGMQYIQCPCGKVHQYTSRSRTVAAKAGIAKKIKAFAYQNKEAHEGLGDALVRMRDALRTLSKEKLANRLDAIIHTCGCDTSTAVENLNKEVPYVQDAMDQN